MTIASGVWAMRQVRGPNRRRSAARSATASRGLVAAAAIGTPTAAARAAQVRGHPGQSPSLGSQLAQTAAEGRSAPSGWSPLPACWTNSALRGGRRRRASIILRGTCDKSTRRANHFGLSEIVSSPGIKNISVFPNPKSGVWSARLTRTQGASAVVTYVAVRCGGRGSHEDERG